MPYAYAPPFGAAVGITFRGAYTAPFGGAVAIPFTPPGAYPIAGDVDYAAWRNTTLVVAAPGVLSSSADPDGLALTAHLVLAPEHGTLSLEADGGFGYVPGTDFLGVDAFAFVARNADGLESDPAVATITVAIRPTTRYEQIGAGVPFGRSAALGRAVASGFALASRLKKVVAAAWDGAGAAARELEIVSARTERVRRSTALAFAKAPERRSEPIELPWLRPGRVRALAALPWVMRPVRTADRALPFARPPRQRIAAALPWSRPPTRGRVADLPYALPPRQGRRWWLPWQHARPVQWSVHGPGVTPPEPEPPASLYEPPFGGAVGLAFVCPQVDLPGMMIPLRFGAAACYFAWPRPRIYTVLNTAHVIATATGQQIEVDSIDIGSSTDEMHHSIGFSLADPADLQWLTPTDSGPIEIECNINGHLWTGIVEEWQRDEAFPGATVRVSARALTALLDAPYAPLRAYVETAERLAQQLVDRELDATGFIADYGIINWTVPAGAWHYDAQTPASAVRVVAEAAGAVARAHPWQRVIEIRPRWPHSPWDWATTAPDKIIHDDYVPRLSGRSATSRAPVYELQIPLWPASAADKPGLTRVGQLVEFAALAGWRAQVTAVRISASMEDAGNGARALVVWQTISLEAPPAAPRFDYVLVSGEQQGVSDPVIRNGTAGTSRLPQIVDPLVTEHVVAAERGRNAIAGGADGRAASNLWLQLAGLLPASRYIKGNVIALNADGSVTIAASDGATIRARPLPEQTWSVTDGVFVQDGRIVDRAPALPGVTQYV